MRSESHILGCFVKGCVTSVWPSACSKLKNAQLADLARLQDTYRLCAFSKFVIPPFDQAKLWSASILSKDIWQLQFTHFSICWRVWATVWLARFVCSAILPIKSYFTEELTLLPHSVLFNDVCDTFGCFQERKMPRIYQLNIILWIHQCSAVASFLCCWPVVITIN